MTETLTWRTIASKLLLMAVAILFIQGFSILFGPAYSLLGVVGITGVLMFMGTTLGYRGTTSFWLCLLSFGIMPLAVALANQNLALGLLLHTVVVFCLMSISCHHLANKLYLPFLLAYIFIYGSPMTGGALLRQTAAALTVGCLCGTVLYLRTKKATANNPLCLRGTFFALSQVQMLFILKMTIGIALSMTLGQLVSTEKGMWICVAVFSLTQPYFHETRARIPLRFKGTLLGVVIFVIVFQLLLPEQYVMVGILLLSYIYTFLDSYFLQVAFITVNSLMAALVLFDTPDAIWYRFSYLAIGALLVLAIGYLFYRRYDLPQR